jgi:hypothetical protein
MGISRRKFVGLASAGAVVPFSQWWSQNASAQTEQPFKRASAHSPAGKRALASYRKAVAEMERLSRTDPKNPIGWTFQYKIHQFPDNFDDLRPQPAQLAAAKRAELDRIFGAGTPERALAARILGTCHAREDAGGDEFWPWHRMYVFFFERICRKLSQDPTFALPYWNYHDPAARTVPEELRIPVGKAANALWHERRPSLNAGQPIPASRLSFGYLTENDFFGAQKAVNNRPHGTVHTYAGKQSETPGAPTYDMLWVGTSPRDPIFWLHHCEIDRAWEQWLSANHSNPADPAWLENRNDPEKGFLFMDENGQPVHLTNAEVLATTRIKGHLGYVYDPPPTPPPAPVVVSSRQPSRNIAVAATVAVGRRWRDAPVQIDRGNVPLAEGSLLAAGARRVLVRIGAIEVKGNEPPANIGLFLNLPADADPRLAEEHLVAVVSTFGWHGHDHKGGDLVFDATEVVRRLAGAGPWADGLQLSAAALDGDPQDDSIVLSDVRIDVVSTTGAFDR